MGKGRQPIPSREVEQFIQQYIPKDPSKRSPPLSDTQVIERIVFPLVNEGFKCLEEGIAQCPSDIDVVYLNGYGFPRHRGGPMHYADTVGLDKVYETICGFEERFGSLYWGPPTLLKELAESGRKFGDL